MSIDPCGMGVDFLRFPPTVPCRFFADRPDIVAPLIWYPCAEDAPDLPIPTAFGSSNWESTAWPHEFPVGETRRPRASDYNGQGVRPLATGHHYCGTPEEFADGLIYDPDAVPPPRRDDGLLLCCGAVIAARGGGMVGGAVRLIPPKGGGMCGGFYDMVPFGPPSPDAGGPTCGTATELFPPYSWDVTYSGPADQWWWYDATPGETVKVEGDGLDGTQSYDVYVGTCSGLAHVGTITGAARVVLAFPGAGESVYIVTGAAGTVSTNTLTIQVW